MKRIICLILATVLCLAMFTGCAQIRGMIGDIGDVSGLEDAHEYICTMYKDLSGTKSKDFDVVAQAAIAGVKYPIEWTVSDDRVVIRESVKTGHMTVDIPEDSAEAFEFTLTATISDKMKNTRVKTFTIKVSAAKAEGVLSILDAIALGKEQASGSYTEKKYYVSGTVKNVYDENWGNMYITDEAGNEFCIYGLYDVTGNTRYDKMTTKPVAGDTVTIYGQVGNYNGTPQIKNGWLTALNGEQFGGSQGGTNTEIYNLVTSIKNGNQVVIGAPAYGKLLSVTKTGYYNVGVDYSADSFANVTNSEIFTVTVNADGSYTFTSLTGEVIALGNEFSSLSKDGTNNSWTLEAKEGANGVFYMKNTGREGFYLEWYAEMGNWSSYNETDLSDCYELSFYLVDEGDGTAPSVPSTPTLTNPGEILEAAYALAENATLSGPFTLTGIITDLDDHKNPTIVIGDYEDMPLYCYKLVDNRFIVGATITVTAKSIQNYKGYDGTQLIEMIDCTLVSIENGHTCSQWTTATCTEDSKCVECGAPGTDKAGHKYDANDVCTVCSKAKPQGVLPENLSFTCANKADGDAYMKTNYSEWTYSGVIGQTYENYLGFGRGTGASKSLTLKSSDFSTNSEFTVTAVIKGNGSSGVVSSTLTFTLVDANGNTVATGYANDSKTAAITPVDGKDTTYDISFVFVEGKTWTDVTNLAISFAKDTGNIGLKTLNFVQ